jgi:hypothetical protein
MKVKTVAAALKPNKTLNIYNQRGGEDGEQINQWIGNGAAIYKLDDVTELTPANILYIAFDIPYEKHKDWIIDTIEVGKEGIISELLSEMAYGATLGEIDLRFQYAGETYWIFSDGGLQLYAINEVYIKPFLREFDYVQFYSRKTSSGGAYVALKVALELKAVLIPSRFYQNGKFMDDFVKIDRLLKHSATDEYGKAQKDGAEEYYGELIKGFKDITSTHSEASKSDTDDDPDEN